MFIHSRAVGFAWTKLLAMIHFVRTISLGSNRLIRHLIPDAVQDQLFLLESSHSFLEGWDPQSPGSIVECPMHLNSCALNRPVYFCWYSHLPRLAILWIWEGFQTSSMIHGEQSSSKIYLWLLDTLERQLAFILFSFSAWVVSCRHGCGFWRDPLQFCPGECSCLSACHLLDGTDRRCCKCQSWCA